MQRALPQLSGNLFHAKWLGQETGHSARVPVATLARAWEFASERAALRPRSGERSHGDAVSGSILWLIRSVARSGDRPQRLGQETGHSARTGHGATLPTNWPNHRL